MGLWIYWRRLGIAKLGTRAPTFLAFFYRCYCRDTDRANDGSSKKVRAALAVENGDFASHFSHDTSLTPNLGIALYHGDQERVYYGFVYCLGANS